MYVPLGYTHPYVNDYAKNEIHGGSPWGVSTVVGSTGERSVLPEELELARHQGKVGSLVLDGPRFDDELTC